MLQLFCSDLNHFNAKVPKLVNEAAADAIGLQDSVLIALAAAGSSLPTIVICKREVC